MKTKLAFSVIVLVVAVVANWIYIEVVWGSFRAYMNACWIDGTVETQSQYARNRREKLIKTYRKLYDKWIKGK